MSLIRQVWLLLLLTLAVVLLGAVGVSVHSARQYLDTQLTLKNNDTAQTLALTLSQFRGDMTAMELALSSQFDTGAYQRIELVSERGERLLSRQAQIREGRAPGWFVAWLAIAPTVGVAQVSDGWRQLGRLEVVSQVDFAYDELWRGTWVTVGLMLAVALAVGGVAWLGVRRIRRPLDAMVSQANALSERRFTHISEPATLELRNVARAMNAMVSRLKAMFDEQLGQVDELRRQAHCDALTGVFNRGHFMSRLKVLLSSEDGSASGALVLVRVMDLQGANRRLGRARTDQLLQSVASTIVESAGRSGAPLVGRLNGTDFALILPQADALREPAVDVAARLRNVLKSLDADATAVVGAMRWRHGAAISSVLASADQALARAESRGAFAVELDDSGDGLVLGEDAWRQHIESAIVEGRLRLMEFPVKDPQGGMVHLECPLRIRLEAAGDWLPAAEWLPMARRTLLTARVDLAAVELALQAIAADGVARAVNLCSGSLQDGSFLPGLRRLLAMHAKTASGLWLEVAEAGALRQLVLLREVVTQAHAFGVRVGLEHAGEGWSESGSLLQAGLDFVKLDASHTEGLAGDTARAQHVASGVRMLRGIGLNVYAEGVSDAADLAALWRCGVNGATGPALAEEDPATGTQP